MEIRKKMVQYLVAASVSLASLTLGVCSSWPTPVLAKFNANETTVHLTEQEQSWMLSLNNPGFIFGSFVTGFTSDRCGRRLTILGSAAPMFLGTIILLFANIQWPIYITRILWGCGTGIISTVVTMYLAEIADSDIRGRLMVGTKFMFNLGALLVVSVGPFLSYQALNSSLVVLPLLYFVACLWIPESPHYHLKEGRVLDAGKTLSRLKSYKGKKAIEEDLATLQSTVADEMRRGSSVKELFCGVQYRKAIIISAGLKFAHIMTGTTTVQHYLGPIMKDTKWGIDSSTLLVIFGVVRFVISMMSSVIADRVGRRPLLIYSFFATGACHIFAGCYFFAQQVFRVDHSSLVQYAWVPFVGILGSNIVSTLGFNSIIFVIPAEIFPLNIKAVALSCLSIFGGVLGFIVAKCFKELKDLVGLSGVLWIYAAVAIAGAVFSMIFVPETKGKSLREIQVILQGDKYEENSGNHATIEVDDEPTELNLLNKTRS